MITLPEFIFINVVTHIYILFTLRSLHITYETFVINLLILYFIGCCFTFGVRIGWNVIKNNKI